MSQSYQKYLEQTMAERGPQHPIWKYNSKHTGRILGERCGLHVPEVYQGPCALRKMTEPQHNVVIKPVEGCSGRGIRPLRWRAEDQYTNLFTGKNTSWQQAVTSAMADKHTPRNRALLEQGHPDAMRPPWLLEELILNEQGGLACDWKAFCFGGRVQVIFQLVRSPANGKQIKWWSRDWQDVGNIMPTRSWKYTPRLNKPHNPERLIHAFESVARQVNSPFIRIDLYEQRDRVVFGEVTPHPTGGTVYFVPEWDKRLGQAWADAL